MVPLIQSKLPAVGTTIFTVMSSLSADYHAINLGQGFPDFNTEEELVERVSIAMKQGHNQYTHMNGLPLLREKIAGKIHRLYQQEINPHTEITITPGATYALYTALTSILNKGDEVIVFEPCYDSYVPNVEINGATIVPIEMKYPDYAIDWDEVRQKITIKTRAIIINSPHNPTGKLLTEEDMAELQSVTENTGIFIVSDEVYEHLVFDDKKHVSVLKYPDLFARSFVCFSFGKVYHCTGWKLGYCIAPSRLMGEFRKVHQFNCFTCNTPMQYALAQYLDNQDAYLSLGKSLQQKRDFFAGQMKDTNFTPLPSYGSYFQLYSYENISKKKELDLAVSLVKNAGVTTIPVSAFYRTPVENKVLRFCFAKKNETLLAAADRLKNLDTKLL